jgi:hypothetical protein
LRHQLHVLQRTQRRRLRLTQADRLLWIGLSRTLSDQDRVFSNHRQYHAASTKHASTPTTR